MIIVKWTHSKKDMFRILKVYRVLQAQGLARTVRLLHGLSEGALQMLIASSDFGEFISQRVLSSITVVEIWAAPEPSHFGANSMKLVEDSSRGPHLSINISNWRALRLADTSLLLPSQARNMARCHQESLRPRVIRCSCQRNISSRSFCG
jgi:hypothetical protein